MCPGLWTLDLDCNPPVDSRAFTLRFLVFLTHSLYPQLSSFCLWIAPLSFSLSAIHTRAHASSLHTTSTFTYHEHDIHQLRTTSINFIRAHLYSDLSFHSISCLFLFTFLLFTTFYDQVLSISFHAHSCFMSITVLICHSSLVSFVCLYSVVSVSLSCTSYLHCDPQAISYSCTI